MIDVEDFHFISFWYNCNKVDFANLKDFLHAITVVQKFYLFLSYLGKTLFKKFRLSCSGVELGATGGDTNFKYWFDMTPPVF